MTCWAATKECFRNCCGGPHSEHYDAWLARERLRQLNAQTQRTEQLQRQNVQLEMALTQTQDIMASYRELDRYEGNSLDERAMSQTSGPFSVSAPTYATRPPQEQAPVPVAMGRRASGANVDLPDFRPAIRREMLRPPAGQQPLPPVQYEQTKRTNGGAFGSPIPGGSVDEKQPINRSSSAGRGSVLRSAGPAESDSNRREVMRRLAAPLPGIPQKAQDRPSPNLATPFGAVAQKPVSPSGTGHPSTHGYKP